jgi:ribosomal protein S2
LKKNKKLSKKKYSFLFGLLDKKSMPSLPDFLFLFFMESTRMQEILKTKKPILGIVSNKIQANQITFPIFGNYLSYNNIFFIFFLMLHAATEALEKDIFLFYNMILKKIYISLKKKN